MHPNYNIGYYETLNQLGLSKLAEAHLEKCAADAGMTKEALRRQIANFFSKLVGRGGMVPGTQAAASSGGGGLLANIKSIASGQGKLLKMPPSNVGNRAKAWESAGGFSPTRATPPKAPIPGSSAPMAAPLAAPAAPAAASGPKPWTLGRKLKWGGGLGLAGAASYNLLGEQGPQGPQQPQQQYSNPYGQGGGYY